MHKARAFFFVCAGIFLLALTYHLGAKNAGAQGGMFEGARCGGGTWTAAVNRVLWVLDSEGLHQAGPPIPGTSSVVATDGGWYGGTTGGSAVLASGDCYYLSPGGSDWQLCGNLLGGNPTPAQSISIGQLKAKYAK